jgi:ligand-binding sensor domain-containing protein
MRQFLLLLSLLLIPGLGFCISDLEFERLNSNHGLSAEEVRNIFQDSEGYLWFLTREGLNRYDGYEFKIYKQGNSELSFTTSAFESICEDQEGRLWLGSFEKGILIFDKFEEKVISFETEARGLTLFDKHIRSLLCDRSGHIWIGTEYGLYRYNPTGKSLDHFNLGDLNQIDPAWCIVEDLMEDTEGNLWIATWSEGLYMFDQKSNSLKNFRDFDGNPYTQHDNQIKTIFQDNLGYIWVGTWEDGLYMTRWNNDDLKIERTYLYDDTDPQSISGNIIYSINQDFNNNLWVGTPYGLTIVE